MLDSIRKLFRERYLNIQAKLVFPLAVTILLLVVVLSPLTNRIINERIEQEVDRRLADIADSVGALIANSETLARNHAALLSTRPEVEGAFIDLETYTELLVSNKNTLELQELSLYKADFQPGDQAYFYGGPTVARRLQVSEDANRIREELILRALSEQQAVSGVAIAPQNSQIIGAAPVYDPLSRNVTGVILTAFYMDQAYIANIGRIINTDVAVVKDNAVITSTIDPTAGYEALINSGWLDSTETPSMTAAYSNGMEYRLLGHPLVISNVRQGSVIVAQPVESLFSVSRNIQVVLITVTSIFGVTALWFWIAAFLAFTRPLAQLTQASVNMSKGDLNQKVNTNYLIFRDEITVLSENFNSMAENLSELYTSLEDKVAQRTRELAEARDEAVAANKSKSEFVSLVSHELKLPMTSIKGYSDLMLSGATGQLNENQSSFLTTIRNNVNRMATLVSDLADISRIESGNLRLEPREVPVWDVIDEVVTLTRTQITQKEQTVTVDIPKELPKAWCDRNRLAQILTNLVSNANKYTPEGGTIVVRAIRAGGMIQVKVQDNGLGMTLEDQERLFSKFFRSADDKVRESPGTGLGLSITKNLVELQGGKIWFESEFRQGTSFYFTVPISDGSAIQA
ncbi:MAG: HAMP domain-containing protein [Chloroflexi bacterium]|nr:HAMP domain-containing protein [Chloroflexota bacterium]